MIIIKVNAISKKYKGAFLSFGQFEEILLEFQKRPKEHKNEVGLENIRQSLTLRNHRWKKV